VLVLVKFFRESVITSGDKIRSSLKHKNILLPIIKLNKNTPTLKFTEEEFFKKISPNYNGGLVEEYRKFISDNNEIEETIRSTLNTLEEFSISIINSNSQYHVAVSSIKKPFVEMVETLAIPLYYHIGITADKFSYLSELYRCWKKEVGFIPNTQKDVEERYKERKEKWK
jgi:hypothetical protein